MYEPYAAVASLAAALMLITGGLALFHKEAGKGDEKLWEWLIIGLLMVIAGFTLLVVPSVAVRRARFGVYDPAEFFVPFGMILIWVGAVGCAIGFIGDGIELLYNGMTHEQRKLKKQAAVQERRLEVVAGQTHRAN